MMIHRPVKPKRKCLCATVLILCVALSGCASQPYLEPAKFAKPLASPRQLDNARGLHDAEVAYALASQLDQQDDERCLERYVACCRSLWSSVTANHNGFESRNHQLYHSAVGRFIEAAQRFGRLDKSQVHTSSNAIPVRYIASSWRPDEIKRFASFSKYKVHGEVDQKQQRGIGIPLVAFRESDRPFIQSEGAFPVTAVLRPIENDNMVLDILNPHAIRHVIENGREIPIATDLSAALAYYEEKYQKTWITGFLRPEKLESTSGLVMVEPYKPGKIPLLFIHGLASNPMTWASMANELVVQPDVMDRYQLWLFEYPTGKPFPAEAGKLRRQLVELRNQIDPNRQDSALDNMVVIGHSMGGLMAKLQITSSGERLANAVFSKPLSELTLSPKQEQEFRDTFYFEPSAQIRRVIFLGTPHRGSRIASNPVGRLASKLVREPTEMVANFAEFTHENANAFVDGLSGIPTSVDLLRPGNRVLEAIFALPVDSRVAMHSVIGKGHEGRFGNESSDGVVPVSSARHPGVESELLVDASHNLHHHDATIREVVRILNEHSR